MAALRALVSAACRPAPGVSTAFSTGRAGAPLCLLARRSYASTPRRRVKELAKAKAAEMRGLLAFATTFDPLRTAKAQLAQTMDKLGWEINEQEMISDGLYVDFSMKDSYCAFEIVDVANILPAGHPDGSTLPASAPLALRADTGLLAPPSCTPFPAAPAPWEDASVGMVLDAATAARHRLIRSKGWSLITIPLPLWQVACAKPHQHYARRDLLLASTLPYAPFEAKPPMLRSGMGGTSLVAPGRKASAGGAGGGDEADAALAEATRTTGTSNRAKRAGAMQADNRRAAAAAAAPKLSGVAVRRLGRKAAAPSAQDALPATPSDDGSEDDADEDDAASHARPRAAAAKGTGAAAKRTEAKIKDKVRERRGLGGRGR